MSTHARSAPPPARRWSLRARLIALVLAVAAIALGAVDVLLPIFVRGSLMDSRDAALRDVLLPLQTDEPFPIDMLDGITENSPLRGEIGLSLVNSRGMSVVKLALAGDARANPALGRILIQSDVPFTVNDVDRGTVKYRALALKRVAGDTGEPVYVVAWLSLEDVDAAVGRLIFTELLITAGLLVLLGAMASVIIRRELKPLESMAAAADDIAAGDLSRRVYPGDAGTEVGRLGFAFNGMLDGISDLVAEREQNSERMRQFLADASHELRTPVAAVRGYTDLYRAGALDSTEQVDRAMERMGFESGRMGALVGDLLTLIQADAESGEQGEAVDLYQVLRGVVDDARVIDRTRQWTLDGSESGSAIVFGDRLRLHQLFANLLANVRTHTDAGSSASVTVRTMDTEVAVVVADNGPGVQEAELPRLFDRFYRVDTSRSRARGGTGLGLSIVAAIVRSHRGRIVASHTPGGGLTVTVVLPQWRVRSSSPSTGGVPIRA